MEITDIKIFKAKKRGPVLAYANIILNNYFIIRRITLIEKNGKRYLSMPATITRESIYADRKEYRDICHPLNNDVRKELTKKVFAAYDEFIKTEE